MNQVQQSLERIGNELEKSIHNPDPFSKYLETLSVPKILLQSLIENHDLQIADAQNRHQSKGTNYKN